MLRTSYYVLHIVIRSFRCKDTRRIFNDLSCARFANIERVARRKLAMLDAAQSLLELARVPGNRLEQLKAGRQGQHSVRINDQWRICFVWKKLDAFEVEIVDYH